MARVLFCWLAACLLALVSGHAAAQASGIARIGPQAQPGAAADSPVLLLTGAVQGNGQWIVHPAPATGPRLLLV